MKVLVRLCFEEKGIHITMFSEDGGIIERSMVVEDAREAIVRGEVLVTKPDIDLGRLCLYAHVAEPSVEHRGKLVIIGGKAS